MFKDHFGTVLTNVLAIVMGIVMAVAVIIIDHQAFNISNVFKIWAMVTFVVLTVSIFVPYVKWGNASAAALHLKEGTIGFKLVAGIIPSLILNTFNTVIVSDASIMYSETIPAAAQTGIWIEAIIHDWPICLVVSYIAAFAAEAIGKKVAEKNVLSA